MSFSTVDDPNLGQHPTFDPGASLLWESSTLKVAQGGRCPTAVINAIGRTALMRASGSVHTGEALERVLDKTGLSHGMLSPLHLQE